MAAATAAFAEQEMVILRDGISGMAEVVKTEPDSITVRFQTKDGTSGETRLLASRVDPHNFFAIRHSHMEKTVENHIASILIGQTEKKPKEICVDVEGDEIKVGCT